MDGALVYPAATGSFFPAAYGRMHCQFGALSGTTVELYNTSGSDLPVGKPPVQDNMVVMKVGQA